MALALTDILSRSFDRADRMVELARSANLYKAASGATLGDTLPGGTLGDGVTRSNYGQASEQYRANRNWVWACIRLIAQRIAGQPIRVASLPHRAMRGQVAKAVASLTTPALATKGAQGVDDADGLEPLDQHPLLDVLADPNPLMVAWSLMFSAVASLELTGRSLLWATVQDGKRVLMPIPTTWIESIDHKRTVFTIRPAGLAKSFPVPGDEVCHFFYPDPSNPYGCLSPLQQIAEAVEADNSIQLSQWRAFKNGINPRVALVVGKNPGIPGAGEGVRPRLNARQRRQLFNAIMSEYGGEENTDKPIILDGLIERVEKLSTTPREMDFLNSSKLTKARILQGFGVNPILLGETEGANRASAYVAEEIFVSNKINPIIQLLSQTMTEWLGPVFSKPNEKLVVWIEPAVARDAEMELRRWQVGGQLGFVSPNEYRRTLLGLPDLPGGDMPSFQSAEPEPEPEPAAAVASASSAASEDVTGGEEEAGEDGSEEAGSDPGSDPGKAAVKPIQRKADRFSRLIDPALNPYTLSLLKTSPNGHGQK